jgi:hypothetical protein
MPVMNADFVSYLECRAEAERQFAERHPDFPLDEAYREFVLAFAANVAHATAAEATKRAKEGLCVVSKS